MSVNKFAPSGLQENSDKDKYGARLKSPPCRYTTTRLFAEQPVSVLGGSTVTKTINPVWTQMWSELQSRNQNIAHIFWWASLCFLAVAEEFDAFVWVWLQLTKNLAVVIKIALPAACFPM